MAGIDARLSGSLGAASGAGRAPGDAPFRSAAWQAPRARAVAFGAARKVYAADETATRVYLVHSGAIKAYSVDREGAERVRGFYFAGDLLGVECIGASRYPATAVTLKPSRVSAIELGELHRMMAGGPEFAQHVLELVSAELRRSLAFGGEYTADQRLAAFLLQLQQRLRWYPERRVGLRLPMTRREIGSHLRLATETVSRVIGRFSERGLVAPCSSGLVLVRPDVLRELAEPLTDVIARAA